MSTSCQDDQRVAVSVYLVSTSPSLRKKWAEWGSQQEALAPRSQCWTPKALELHSHPSLILRRPSGSWGRRWATLRLSFVIQDVFCHISCNGDMTIDLGAHACSCSWHSCWQCTSKSLCPRQWLAKDINMAGTGMWLSRGQACDSLELVAWLRDLVSCECLMQLFRWMRAFSLARPRGRPPQMALKRWAWPWITSPSLQGPWNEWVYMSSSSKAHWFGCSTEHIGYKEKGELETAPMQEVSCGLWIESAAHGCHAGQTPHVGHSWSLLVMSSSGRSDFIRSCVGTGEARGGRISRWAASRRESAVAGTAADLCIMSLLTLPPQCKRIPPQKALGARFGHQGRQCCEGAKLFFRLPSCLVLLVVDSCKFSEIKLFQKPQKDY